MGKTQMKPAVLHIDIETGLRGGQKQALMLYEALIEKGMKTNFICRKKSGLEKYFIKRNMNYYSFSNFTSFSMFHGIKISRFAKKNNYNIIHCHSSHSLNLGIIAKFFYRKLKLIGSRRVMFRVKNKMKYNSFYLDKIIAVSDAVKKQMVSSGINENKLIAIHDGIAVNEIRKTVSVGLKNQKEFAKSFLVGTSAAFTNEKDYPTLVEAAKIVVKKNPDIKFIFLGKGNLLDETKELINENNLIKNVFTLGYVDNPLDYIKDFDIYVTSTKSEGLGTSILDAMALGKPVVATNTGGIPEIVHHNQNGILFEKGNSKELADAIIKLYDAPEIRLAMSKTTLEIVQKYDVENTVKKTIRLYEELLIGEK
jgi:glycosyltransferase involved in cell wall biosynthesis